VLIQKIGDGAIPLDAVGALSHAVALVGKADVLMRFEVVNGKITSLNAGRPQDEK